MSAAAAARAREVFDVEEIVKRYEEFYMAL